MCDQPALWDAVGDAMAFFGTLSTQICHSGLHASVGPIHKSVPTGTAATDGKQVGPKIFVPCGASHLVMERGNRLQLNWRILRMHVLSLP